jgi:Rrf2 family transcriptional regulator, cysteine metabolism repressor
MKVSTRTRYGIRAVVELARQEGQNPLQLRVIGEREEISVKYLEQLMAVLKAAGLVRSVRGAKGGYVLARPADQIKMDEVYRCLEGPVVTVECIEDPEACKRVVDCAARDLWINVEKAIHEVLESTTLADIATKAQEVAARQQEQGQGS